MQIFPGSADYPEHVANEMKKFFSAAGLTIPSIYARPHTAPVYIDYESVDVPRVTIEWVECEPEEDEECEDEYECDYTDDRLVSLCENTNGVVAEDKCIPVGKKCVHVKEDMLVPPIVLCEVNMSDPFDVSRAREPGVVKIGNTNRCTMKSIVTLPYGDNCVRVLDYDGSFMCPLCHQRAYSMWKRFYIFMRRYGNTIPLRDVGRILLAMMMSTRDKDSAIENIPPAPNLTHDLRVSVHKKRSMR